MVLLLGASEPTLMELLLENVLALTILFIFAAAILGAFLRSRTRDRCLKDFHGYPISLTLTGKSPEEGTLGVFSAGFEVVYSTEKKSEEGNSETSTLLYESEYKNIRVLHRYHDQLTDRNQKRRLKEITRCHKPNFLRRGARKLRNFFNILRDAIVKSFDAFLGSAKKTSQMAASQGGQMSGMSQDLIGHFGNAYDPILERFVGKKVIVDVEVEDGIKEYPGILKEYTDQFLEILSVPLERDCDLIVPRVHAVVRHAGKKDDLA